MSDNPPDYQVGYKKPPLHTRFQKGQSGNPLGGRLHRRPDKRLAELLDEALDRRMSRKKRPTNRREAVVAALVEQAAAGDLRAVKLLLDCVGRSERQLEPEIDPDEEDPREVLIREIDRLEAEEEALNATRDYSVVG